MALTNASIDVNKVIEHLREKWSADRLCPMCGVNNWDVQDSVFQISQFIQGAFVAGPVIPLIPVTCNNCGNTVLINALKANILVLPEILIPRV